MIILTGHEGFIGQNFCEELDLGNVYRVEKDDACTFLDYFNDWGEVELILHQGAISSTVETNINKIHRYNVDYTLRLFEKAIEHQIPVRYASSASVYGNFGCSLDANKVMNPLNYYAISKLQIDYWVQQNIDRFSNIQGFRYFNVFGGHEELKVLQNQSSPVSKFVNDIKQTGKIRLFEGSDKMVRDFVYVKDVVDIVLNNNLPSGIYDLGTGFPVSFQHVADAIVDKIGGEIEYIPFPEHLKDKYQYYTCADMSSLNEPYAFTTVEEYVKDCIH